MLKPENDYPISEETAKVTKAAFPNGNIYLTLRDTLGPIFADELFKDLYPALGQPAESPESWPSSSFCNIWRIYRTDKPPRWSAAELTGNISWD
jgi:hypothetical protein